MQLPPVVVFDLDGTLVDTADDLAAAMNHCLALKGCPPLSTADVRPLIGHGARALLAQGLAAAGVADDALIEQLMPEFLRFYGSNIAVHSKPYARVIETLDVLTSHGCALGVCTNKPEGLSLTLLGALDLMKYFGAVLGSDTLAVRKPDPEHLFATISRLSGLPQHTVMVGDSNVDIATAHAAKIPVVGVTFGFTTIPMAELNPTVMIDHYRDMLPALARAHARRP